jgi:hypothetical protein
VVQVWAELGIAPTRDAGAIRRAYAARLKLVRPDASPDAFARLREAYERALSMAVVTTAARPAATQPGPGKPPTPAADPASPFTPLRDPLEEAEPLARDFRPPPPEVTSPPRPARPADMEPVTGLLRRGQVAAAADWLGQARRDVRLRLEDDVRLADQIGWAMARDLALPAAEVRKAAARLGWDREASGAWAPALQARLDAETWLETVQRSAKSPARWLGGPAAAHTLLLGRGRLRSEYMTSGNLHLRRAYGQFLLHRPVVGQHFDPERMESIGKAMTWKAPRWMSWPFALLMLIFLPVGLGGRAGEIDPRLQTPVMVVTAILVWGFAGYLFVRWLRIRSRRRR